ncbi:Acid phosphatase-like protein 2 [Lobosporangium transversale]|uniref:Histidine phosphatase superfamily n=1 Tax=Lobosporangium transversale TaxID=64571 RepID=A0A1Y2GLM2_9FUNG|nr:histidine phosphatase superfamily [Lobosporangium transversale]KAF9901362.1 Acid phosphatase-like protein 2 [Lobosporangium transversale]ORZ13414.1 histidine phosphatase superfamily [Lobosporangium transversale]|eukprot:XP_021880495.1 histidine phosphatase superfamily [Lobosporangium transversale]
MIIESRLVVILLTFTAGGLFLAISHHTANLHNYKPIAIDILDHAHIHNDNTPLGEYNYCQASRPTLKTYPSPKLKGSTLMNSQIFIRHGDRTPIAVLPLDLNLTWDCTNADAFAFTGFRTKKDERAPFQYANVVAHQVVTTSGSPFAATRMWKGNCMPGQLTPVGAMQHRKLGAALRQIYVDNLKSLPADYDPETVYIRSTDFWRTKQSAENFMAGLYGIQHHSESSPPPVLHIHTLPTEIDYLTINSGACPRVSQLRTAIGKSSEALRKLREDNVEFNNELIEILGEEKSWSGYLDTVMPRICHKMPLQCNGDKCVTSKAAKRILDNVHVQNTVMYRDGNGVLELLQLGIGPLASDIKQNLLIAKEGNSKVRLSFYSGHDTTIQPLLGMFDAEDQQWPPYASNIILELWKSSPGEHFVRVLYNGEVLDVKSNWCDLEWCPFDTFIKYLDRFILKDLMAKCQSQ